MNIKNTIKELKENKIVAMSTDTIPGLHAISSQENALKIINIKKDTDRLEKGFVHIGTSLEDFDLVDLSKIDSQKIRSISIMRKNPVTWIVPAIKYVKYLTRKDKTIAIRIVSDNELRIIIKAIGKCLISTSYNLSNGQDCIFDVHHHGELKKKRSQPSKKEYA